MIFLLFLLLVPAELFADCIPAKNFIPYPKEFYEIGSYQRVHPSGDYVLHSSIRYELNAKKNNNVSVVIFDLKHLSANKEATYIETPMIDEAYPIMTDWSLIASPNHQKDGMRYYSFDELKKNGVNAHFDFNDPNHNQYYHSIGEISNDGVWRRIRVILLSRDTKEYDIRMENGRAVEVKVVGEAKKSCENIYNNSTDTFYGPVLSTLGDEVATQRYPKGNLAYPNALFIMKINDDYSCTVDEILNFQTSKPHFSFPVEGKKGQLTFRGPLLHYNSNYAQLIYVYDRDTKRLKQLYKLGDYDYVGFSGFAQDGRVIFPACKRLSDKSKSCGAVIIVPNQIDDEGNVISQPSSCIESK